MTRNSDMVDLPSGSLEVQLAAGRRRGYLRGHRREGSKEWGSIRREPAGMAEWKESSRGEGRQAGELWLGKL